MQTGVCCCQKKSDFVPLNLVALAHARSIQHSSFKGAKCLKAVAQTQQNLLQKQKHSKNRPAQTVPIVPFFLYDQNKGKNLQIQGGTSVKSYENGQANSMSFMRIWGSDTPWQLFQFGIKHSEIKSKAVFIFGEVEGPFTAQKSGETHVFNTEHGIASRLFLWSMYWLFLGFFERESMHMIQRKHIFFLVQNTEILVLFSSLSCKHL